MFRVKFRLSRTHRLWLLAATVFLSACIGWLQGPEAGLTGRVVSVADGDTVTVLDAQQRQHRVRLKAIDAPEKGQPFAERSREHLAALVAGRMVRIEAGGEDRYGRTVGRIVVDGRDVNLAQLEAGMAWHYKAYEREQPLDERRRYAEAERDAREAGWGLWAEPHPVAPWAHRRSVR